MSVFSNTNGTKMQPVGLDVNNDGTIDRYVDIDTNADGKVDERVDLNGDGKLDSVALDTDLNGIVDGFLPTDLNNDGKEDYTVKDLNFDGIFDVYSQKTTIVNNTVQSIQNMTEESKKVLDEINKLNQSTNNIAQKAALDKALSGYIDSMIEAEATKKTLSMSNQANKQNALLDQQMLALRHNYNVLSKQTEQYVLDAQVREQLTNLFFTLEKTMMDNTFALAKSVVQSAKY